MSASEARLAALAARVDALDAEGLRRRLRSVTPLDATHALVDGERLTLFCSNDYLGLAHHPDVLAAWRQGAGAGASRLISGDRPAHRALEDALAERFGRPATLFNSGYAANLAVLTTLLGKTSLVASDALNHASIVDGARLSGARRHILAHASAQVPTDTDLVVVEGLYSMDGDTPDLSRYPHGPWLVVDEAHAVGCLGPDGRGVAAAQGVVPDVLIGTLGKAAGAAGAFVVGPPELRELLVSAGRSLVYTTALPEPVAHAARVGLSLCDDARREALAANVARLRGALVQLGVEALGDAHVVPVRLPLGDAPPGESVRRTMAAADALRASGFLVPGIRYPTVPRGQERLRVTVSAAHTPDELDRLAEALARVTRAGLARDPRADGPPARVVRRVLRASVAQACAFAADPRNLPRWAAGVAGGVERVDGRWFADGPLGRVEVRMPPVNDAGILDHVVAMPDGTVFDNRLRLLPHPEGCEAVFTLPPVNDADADAAAVAADLAALDRCLAGEESR